MEGFLHVVLNMINTKVGVAIITAIATLITTIVCQTVYLKMKQKTRYEKVIGDKIAGALDTVRKIEISASNIDIVDIDDLLEKPLENIDFFEEGTYCPEIMTTPENFSKFFDNVRTAREDCEIYLNYTIAAYLYYMERYCMNIIAYAGQNSIPLDLLGTVTLFDFQNWQKRFDEELVKLINKPKYKVYSLNGSKWDQAKENVMDEFWENSILYKLISDDNSPEIKAAKAILFHDPDAETLVNQLKKLV